MVRGSSEEVMLEVQGVGVQCPGQTESKARGRGKLGRVEGLAVASGVEEFGAHAPGMRLTCISTSVTCESPL